ncbi:hypothetical protein C0Q70_18501 [Pomacea canaliculata]|uniref:Uncharacterized protein n=1 Tax=Pomacea canaliculata TaxID=400727 RepID=A0A2T7NGP0_POMCA|nr:uncharacterized protein LOC112553335 [Pomacea canaliculata]PVD20347.1 hypothetical protein C0Q70_18501 [Pomacea canaliculata]
MIARPLCLSLVALVLLTWTPIVGCEPANVAAVNNPTSAGGREHPPSDLSDVANNGIRERRGLPQEDISDDSEEEEDDEAVRDEHDVLAGFPLDDLDDDGLQALLDIDDEIFYDQAGEHVTKKMLLEDRKVNRGSSLGAPGALSRRKRIAPLVARAALIGARALFRSFARSGVTRSGARVTRHYNGRGNYGDAVRHFQNLRPNNVRSFQSGRISGQTGTIGNHRVTVRNGSSSGRPTLEVRSHNGQVVRKFRFN